MMTLAAPARGRTVNKPIRTIGLFCFLLQVGALAVAHTPATSTNPKSGSVLEQSPPTIQITFKDAVRMTSVVVAQEGKPERKLESSPQETATTFTIAKPELTAGRSEVRWTALSKDGHVMKGVIDLTIKPAK